MEVSYCGNVLSSEMGDQPRTPQPPLFTGLLQVGPRDRQRPGRAAASCPEGLGHRGERRGLAWPADRTLEPQETPRTETGTDRFAHPPGPTDRTCRRAGNRNKRNSGGLLVPVCTFFAPGNPEHECGPFPRPGPPSGTGAELPPVQRLPVPSRAARGPRCSGDSDRRKRVRSRAGLRGQRRGATLLSQVPIVQAPSAPRPGDWYRSGQHLLAQSQCD